MKNLITCLVVTTLLVLGVTSDGNANTNSPLDHDINNSLQLKHSWHTALSINQTPGQSIRLAIPIENRTYTLELDPYSTRSDEYAVFMQDNKGELYEVPAGAVRTLRGSIAELDGSVVAGSLMPDGLYARIRLVDGKEYWMEPLVDKINGAAHNLYVFYRTEDVIPSDGVCATDELMNAGKSFGVQTRRETNRGSFRGNTLCTAQLAFDTDYEYYQDWGSNTESRINQIVNSINVQYESEVNLTHEITTIIVRSNSNDPYSSNNHETLLYQFQDEWTSNQSSIPRDVAHLFTGKELDGSVIGVAWVGVICNFTYQYGLSQSDFDGNYSCATDLTAHELGHNWNAGHCDCPSHTMNPYITCANQFTQGSINTITSFANSLSCLSCGTPDPTGGCCVGENCSIMTASDCSAWGGTYLGDNTNCNGDPCYVPQTGACCIGSNCSIMTASDCSASGGSFLGDDSNCQGNPCNDGVWNVPGDFATIQEAIDASSDGEEIIVAPGTYTGNGDEVVDTNGKAIWLHSSNGPEVTIIDGQGVRTGIHCHSGETTGTKIEGFTITNCRGTGSDDSGGGMRNSFSTPTVTNCMFTYNSADWGGGMFNDSGSPMLTGCTFTDNIAAYGGGGMGGSGSPTLTGCRFTYNSANYGGGMFNAGGSPTLINTIVCGNTPDQINGSWIDGGGNIVSDECVINVPEDFSSIQEAIDFASDGDEIVVYPGVYTRIGSGSIVDTMGKRIRIYSYAGPETTIISGEGEYGTRGIRCVNGETQKTVIEGFTITGGNEIKGAGIYCDNNSNPSFIDCVISSNGSSSYGGGVAFVSCSPTLINCIISGNSTDTVGGGMYLLSSDPTITDCTFYNNFSSDAGGGVYIDVSSGPLFSNCSFVENGANNQAGGVFISSSGSTLTECLFDQNHSGWGGGLWCSGAALITNCLFTNNVSTGVGGGGMYIYYADPVLTNCIFTGNVAQNNGGAIYCADNSSPLINDCMFENNTGTQWGGGMYNYNSSSPTLTNCTLTGNTAGNGGGMYNHGDSNPTLSDCTFESNFAHTRGGGMYNDNSSPTLADCTFTDNTAPTDGGGMYSTSGSPTLENCTLCSNTPNQISGDWTDNGGNTIADECPVDCDADITGDGIVNINDLLTLIANWNTSSPLGDVNEDGIVDVEDLLLLIAAWGVCP